ncbi:hypothetical protein HBB16_18640 [Pseudonocardia sp. MCCB 268]|nr:hypothetical protein [Pseudonocardia cytotoxica]
MRAEILELPERDASSEPRHRRHHARPAGGGGRRPDRRPGTDRVIRRHKASRRLGPLRGRRPWRGGCGPGRRPGHRVHRRLGDPGPRAGFDDVAARIPGSRRSATATWFRRARPVLHGRRTGHPGRLRLRVAQPSTIDRVWSTATQFSCWLYPQARRRHLQAEPESDHALLVDAVKRPPRRSRLSRCPGSGDFDIACGDEDVIPLSALAN